MYRRFSTAALPPAPELMAKCGAAVESSRGAQCFGSAEAEGQGERISGGARQLGEQAKDAVKNAKDAFRR